MPHERCAERLAALGIPESHGLVLARRGEALAVGAEGDAPHASSWPVSGAPRGLPLSASQSRTVLSPLAEARRLPSGLKATLDTMASWPCKIFWSWGLASSAERSALCASDVGSDLVAPTASFASNKARPMLWSFSFSAAMAKRPAFARFWASDAFFCSSAIRSASRIRRSCSFSAVSRTRRVAAQALR